MRPAIWSTLSPRIRSADELLAAITSLKHRAILMTAYGAGLRIGEVLALEVGNIDAYFILLATRLKVIVSW